MRLTMSGVPPTMNAAALLPTMPVTPRATTYRQVRIYGQPGTAAIPAPKPAALVPVSQRAFTQPSFCAPDVIYPSVYVAFVDNMHAPVGMLRDNQMPVPAKGNFGRVGRLAPQAFKRRGVGGQKQIDWPAVVSRFPSGLGSRFHGQ